MFVSREDICSYAHSALNAQLCVEVESRALPLPDKKLSVILLRDF
jgi:hypothetical protein